ncbi:MAG TPA: hypothetical protein P5175_10850 [Anaerohalosphaeraceae bacterium]|nr:hypothetical protein [Anaerohalosphaeraceae bacterium]
MNRKAKGARLERKTIKMLQSAGYQCIRSAASLGVFDVVAMNHLGLRCIQVKANSWPGPIEREGLRAAAKSLPPNALIECWRWNDNARKPLIKHLDELTP